MARYALARSRTPRERFAKGGCRRFTPLPCPDKRQCPRGLKKMADQELHAARVWRSTRWVLAALETAREVDADEQGWLGISYRGLWSTDTPSFKACRGDNHSKLRPSARAAGRGPNTCTFCQYAQPAS